MRAGAKGIASVLALDPRDRPLYTLREAARYLGVPEATLRTWVRGRSYPVHGGQGWSEPLIATPEGGPLLSFHNLVEANVLAALRKEHRITMGKVRQMVAYARKRLGVARPLLLDLKAGLGDIFLEDPQGLLALTRAGQMALEAILRDYLSRVERDEGGFPVRFRPPVAGQVRSERVVLDPRVAFGAPTVAGVKTRVLALRYDSGESLEALAEDYGLPLEAVREAVIFEGLLECGFLPPSRVFML
ncbi:DUF433 domain-containing protein [Thermus caldilimi]|uniref:DUF433 domain-containing protein n=1 Tax=Thermus caldilimi TaxID=2483360 RepID=UPI001F0D8BFB|nr:DUF433 domain-containing protein [Thermus caldilimi]